MSTQAFVDVNPSGDDPDTVVTAYVAAYEAAVGDGNMNGVGTGAPPAAELPLEAVAERLAENGEEPATVVHDELLDQLLMEMTTAVIDVERLATELPLELSPKAIQQRIEGRAGMTLREYALIRHAIVSNR